MSTMKNKIQNLSRTVSQNEYQQVMKELSVYGFARIQNFLTEDTKNLLLKLTQQNYDKLNADGRVEYAGTPERNKSDKVLYNLQTIDKLFIDVLTISTITDIAREKLNDAHYGFLPQDVPNYVMLYYNARSSGAKLDLHIDSHIPFVGKHTNMMQLVYLLEDSDLDNGCTVVVPGSHQSGTFTDRELQNRQPLTGKAGDLILWDSRLWHGTLENSSNRSRWALIATLGMWWIKPSMDIVKSMPNEIYQQCSDQQRQLLGFCSIPPVNPLERNNTKCGYDFLKPSVKDYRL